MPTTIAPTSYAARGMSLPPPRADIPQKPRALVANRYEPLNVSSTATVATVQGAIRAAEAGETRELFALYRDLTIAGSHVQAELSKRILAVISEPITIHPASKDNAEDEKAAVAVRRMIRDCENWNDGLAHLLSATIWPVAVVEKIFRPVESMENAGSEARLQYTLRRLEIVNPTLLCFREPYLRSAETFNVQRSTLNVESSEVQWEQALRFYSTDADGRILYDYQQTYAPEPARHIIHRGHLLVGVRDNWGGPMRAILFWWLLGTLGRDWFARFMERYGAPWPIAKTDTSNKDALEFLREALKLSTTIGGLVVSEDTIIELQEAATSGAADAYEKFLSACNKEISKVIVGQTLSAEAQSTGLGSSVGKLQGEVREDYKRFDIATLGSGALPRQLFKQFLQINGLKGSVVATWGSVSPEEIASTAELLTKLSLASLEPTDEAIPTISERLGFQIQRKEAPPSPPPGERAGVMGFNNSQLSTRNSKLHLLTADALGVPASWLNPVARLLTEIERKVADKTLSDRDLLAFLDTAAKRVPELFGAMDVDALAEVLEAGMGQAVIDGVRAGLKKTGKQESGKTGK